ncbi:MAG: type I-B CRISPR-associated protein Cas7/Cst2/DevR [bacterium]
MKCISMVWLTRADLSNLNSGQGSGNLTELKTYDRGRKPYVSGQATRTALFDTIARAYADRFRCTPERPCADVAACWSCDLRGFLATEEGVGGQRRWSPVKVTPGLGQIPGEIVTDLLTRTSVLEKDEQRQSKDLRIAHVQMMENIYRFGMVIDVENIGLVREPVIEGTGSRQQVTGWKTVVDIGPAERKLRLKALLDGVFNWSGLAKQARAAASLSPDFILLALQGTYNQRGLKALELDEEGRVKLDLLQAALQEHRALGNKVFCGYTPGTAVNEGELLELFSQESITPLPVYQVFARVREEIGD